MITSQPPRDPWAHYSVRGIESRRFVRIDRCCLIVEIDVGKPVLHLEFEFDNLTVEL